MALFERFLKGLEKTRTSFSEGFNRLATSLGIYDETMLDELEMLLVAADTGVPAATRTMEALRRRMKETGQVSRAQVLRMLRDELLKLLGPQTRLELASDRMNVVLLVGVNGTGKTTTAGKLCARFSAEGRKPVLAAADTFRAAAIEQLEHWAKATGTPLIRHSEGSDPAAVVFDAVQSSKARGAGVLVVDTAGRLHNKQNLMDELSKIRRVIGREAPDARCTTLLVIDATTGQNAVVQAKLFREAASVDGVVLTKLDGNAKGGVAIAVAFETRVPILLAGLGESVDDLVDFDADSFVDSLLPTP
jgi:fused signal recognition particle receptor